MTDTTLQLYANFTEEKYVNLSFFLSQIEAAFKKVKGRANSIKEIVMLLKDALLNSENQTIYVSHADCSQEEVDQIVSIIKKEIPCKDICIGFIGPIIGASIGPDAIAVYGFGKPVTFNKGE